MLKMHFSKQFFVLAAIAVCCGLRVVSCESVDGNKTSLSPYLNKRYELAKGDDDNFEDLMEYLGVGWLMRKAIVMAKPVMELKLGGGQYTLCSESFFKNIYTTFRLGVEFEEKTPDGRYVDTKFTAEGNKLTQTQKDEKGRVTTIVREFKPEEVVVTASVDKYSCVRIYKAVAV
uniref:Lipocalin/cytosolic fatty-acid binding domain-containing protein n=1 Tax=Homalodisca liturata TaxID=320908 RepID=A0A1B6I6W8_9HEMI